MFRYRCWRKRTIAKQFKHLISSLCVKKAKKSYHNKRKSAVQGDYQTKLKEFQIYFVYINQIIHDGSNVKPFLPFFLFHSKKNFFAKDIFIHTIKYFLWWHNKYGSIEQYSLDKTKRSGFPQVTAELWTKPCCCLYFHFFIESLFNYPYKMIILSYFSV